MKVIKCPVCGFLYEERPDKPWCPKCETPEAEQKAPKKNSKKEEEE